MADGSPFGDRPLSPLQSPRCPPALFNICSRVLADYEAANKAVKGAGPNGIEANRAGTKQVP